MTPHDRLEELFAQSIGMSGGDFEEFVARECSGDAELAAQLRALRKGDEVAAGDPLWQASACEVEALFSVPFLAETATGSMAGPYRLEEVIGRGGMGEVYRASRADSEYQQSVAVKKIRAGAQSDELASRFRSERQILAQLEHPNIARLHDGGTGEDGLPWLAMEYVVGVPLNQYCERHNLALEQRLKLFREICLAVHYAHRHMVVHRDLKPANILVTEEGTPKLLDFGIAKLLDPGAAPGGETLAGGPLLTPGYASPEQIRGEPVTAAADIYSLGVILYELLTGRGPYGPATRPTHEVLHAVLNDLPRQPSVASGNRRLRGDLDNIVLMALRKEPELRYSSAAQMADDIDRYLKGLPVAARGHAPAYLAARFLRRNKLLVAAALLLLATLVGGIITTSRAQARAERRFSEVRRLAHSVVFDYHDAIEPLPGSTPVRKMLVQDALRYLDGLAREADDESLRRELVEAYVRISNVQGNSYQSNLGDSKGALASARKAVAIGQSLKPAGGGDAPLALAWEALATLRYQEDDLTAAEQNYRKALEIERRVRRLKPDDSANLVALSQTLLHLGDLYGGAGLQNLGRTSEGIASYREAAELGRALVKASPSHQNQRELYGALAGLGFAELSAGRTAEADGDLKEALALIEGLAAQNPDNAGDRTELAAICIRIGYQMEQENRAAAALPYFNRAAEIMQVLAALDPKNAQYARDLSVTESHVASALRKTGDLTAALGHARRSLELAEAVHNLSGSAELLTDVGLSRRRVAEILVDRGDYAEAVQEASKSVATLRDWNQGHRDASVTSFLARALVTLGTAQSRTSYEAAAKAFGEAEVLLEGLAKADPAAVQPRADLARAQAAQGESLIRLSRCREAKPWLERAVGNWNQLRNSGRLAGEDGELSAKAARATAACGK